ncbi:unnamed protein product [Rhodiola kirilowii]
MDKRLQCECIMSVVAAVAT